MIGLRGRRAEIHHSSHCFVAELPMMRLWSFGFASDGLANLQLVRVLALSETSSSKCDNLQQL